MRITEREKTAIVKAVLQRDSRAKVYLYGSRADDSLKGGDIDLLVFSEALDLSAKVDILLEIKKEIGEQKIDLLIRPPGDLDPFVREILRKAVEMR